MKNSRMRFYLLPLFLMVIYGSATYAFQTNVSLLQKDTAIINDWYTDAFLSMKDDLKKSDDFINKAWKMSIDIAYEKGVSDGYYYTGCVYEQKGAMNVASRYFEKAISLYVQGQFLDNLPDCYRRLGEIYMNQGRNYTALLNFLNGLHVAEDQRDYVNQIELSIQLANYHNRVSKDYDGAISVLNNAEKLANKQIYLSAFGPIYLQYGISYCRQRNYEQARYYVRKAKQEFDVTSSPDNHLKALFVEGEIYEKLLDGEQLFAVLNQAKPLLDSIVNDSLETTYGLLRAKALYQTGDYNAALAACEELNTKLADQKREDDQYLIFALQFKILYALRDFRKADQLFNDYEYTRDSLYTAQYIGQGIEMSENYKLDKFKRQILEQELKLSNSIYQRYGFIAGIAVLLIILGILYFHFREKDKLAHREVIKNSEISVQNEILKQTNRHNELLMREIHHRVKNNLQIINSLLSLQARKTTNREVVEMMKESRSRINSIALIHNKLYQQQSLNKLNIQDYIEQLGVHLLSIYNNNKNVRIHVDTGEVTLDIDIAIPVGLILTELITNSLKYAFVEREDGEIYIHVKHNGENDYELIFKDNGIGIPEAKLNQNNDTLGFRLIHSLTKQLAGIIHYTFGEFSLYNIRFKG
ncbi:tetratricopeptide repeat-containing sensor histidine kinase [Parapedobacter tibetensis]|uniref:tetratricopeptide repeat-containing sensor histidine kinase n=1 Tax=Parapedobacter tibetensis TaxID=2972951 RepID=UPI00214DEDFD|nr:sensor histidine kinase [Parapedobacter tibetensis]